MKFKIVILCALLFAGFVGSFILFNRTKVEDNSNTFIVGITGGYAPFISMNEKGDYEGFDIDFAQELAATMGKKLVLKDLGSMAPLIMAVEQGSVDAVIWGISITQDRLKKFAMIHYQGETRTSDPLLFAKPIPTSITSLADMKGMTVCVEPASSQSNVLSKYKDIVIMPTEKVDDALLNILYGKADAAYLDPAIAQKFKARYPELHVLNAPLNKEDQVQGVGVVIKQTNGVLINQVQDAINQLKNNGTIKRYEQKWGME